MIWYRAHSSCGVGHESCGGGLETGRRKTRSFGVDGGGGIVFRRTSAHAAIRSGRIKKDNKAGKDLGMEELRDIAFLQASKSSATYSQIDGDMFK